MFYEFNEKDKKGSKSKIKKRSRVNNLLNKEHNFMNMSMMEALKESTIFSVSVVISNTVGTCGSFANNVILANIDKDTLAASGLISTLQAFIISGSCSVLCSISSTVSRTKDYNKLDSILKKGFLASLILSIPSVVVVLNSDRILNNFGQEKRLIDIVQAYFNGYVWGIPALFLLASEQQFSLGTKNTFPVTVVTGVHAVLTATLGYVLVFGQLNFPALGAAGFGYASSLASWISLIGFSLYLQFSPKFQKFLITPFSLKNLWSEFNVLIDLFKVGAPMGIHIGSEVLAMPITSAMIGALFGTKALSSHQIATQYILLALTPSFSISQASSILVAEAIKKENFFNAKRLGNVCIALGVSLSALSLLIYAAIPKTLISPFIDIEDENNLEIIDMAEKLLIVGGIGQMFDSLGTISEGALQGGFRDTSISMIYGILGTCILAIPLGYILGAQAGAGLGILGVYWARDIGIALEGIVLSNRWYRKIADALLDSGPIVTTPIVQGTNKRANLLEGQILQQSKAIQNKIDEPKSNQLLFSYPRQRINVRREDMVLNEGEVPTIPPLQKEKKSVWSYCSIM